MFTIQIAVYWTDTKNWGNSDVWEFKFCQYCLYKLSTGFSRADFFVHVEVQYRSTCIFTLQFILHKQGLKGVFCVIHRQLRAIGVIRVFWSACLEDFWVPFEIFLGKSVGGTFCRSGL